MKLNRPLILVALLVAAFAINLDTTIVNVALPTLVRTLHSSDSQLQWIVDAYNLVFAAVLLSAGSLSDRFGRKGMLLAGLGVFGTSSLAGSLMTTTGGLIVARCFMGLGAAMVFPSTLSLISNIFTERTERARAIGLWGATAGMAIALGPIVGGWLLEQFSWSSIFVAMAPVAAVGAALVARFVPTSRDPRAPALDGAGFGLSTAAMALLVFTIIEAPDHGWGSARSLAGFGVAAVLIAAFLLAERRTASPMLDISLFRNPRFAAACSSVTVGFFTLFGFTFMITQFFQFIKHYSPLSAGVHLLPVAACVGTASVLGTRLAVRFGTKLVVGTGLALVAGFYVWVSTGNAATTYGTIAAQMVMYGIGLGLTSAPATEAILDVVPPEQAGVGSAVNDSTRLLGGTLGVAVIGSVFASVYSRTLTSGLPRGLPAHLGTLATSSVGAALSVVRDLAAGGHAALATPLLHAGTHAFVRGMSEGCLVAGGVAAAGAIAAAIWLPSHPPKEMVSAEDLVTPAAPAIASRAGHPLQHLTAVTETHGGGEPGKM
jgi:EmrB/QacA subfamily drug resistance transporter